jgi:hypothetical protein
MSVLSNPQAYVPGTYPNCTKRKFRQRYDENLLPVFVAGEADGKVYDVTPVDGPFTQVGTYVVTGKCTRRHPMEGTYYDAECIEVTLNDGTIVPCSRLIAEKGENYVICQDRSFKAKRANVKYQFELTDTMGGEANYSWVQRTTVEVPPGTSDKALVRMAKKWASLNGVRCEVQAYGDMIAMHPRGMCQVLFVNFVE